LALAAPASKAARRIVMVRASHFWIPCDQTLKTTPAVAAGIASAPLTMLD